MLLRQSNLSVCYCHVDSFSVNYYYSNSMTFLLCSALYIHSFIITEIFEPMKGTNKIFQKNNFTTITRKTSSEF
jgi:hypothetical protein